MQPVTPLQAHLWLVARCCADPSSSVAVASLRVTGNYVACKHLYPTCNQMSCQTKDATMLRQKKWCCLSKSLSEMLSYCDCYIMVLNEGTAHTQYLLPCQLFLIRPRQWFLILPHKHCNAQLNTSVICWCCLATITGVLCYLSYIDIHTRVYRCKKEHTDLFSQGRRRQQKAFLLMTDGTNSCNSLQGPVSCMCIA